MQNSGSFGSFGSGYRVYSLRLFVNEAAFSWVVISAHYEEKHGASIHDSLILDLVKKLQNRSFLPDKTDEQGFQYFVTEPVILNGKPYRLVWLIPPDKSYLGVRNAFRRTYGK